MICPGARQFHISEGERDFGGWLGGNNRHLQLRL